MKKIESVIFFPNGNQAAFDENGDQIPELQESWLMLWAKLATEHGYDVTSIKRIKLQNGTHAKIFKTEEGFNWEL